MVCAVRWLSKWWDVKYDNVEMVALALSKIGYGMRVRVIQCEGGVCAHKLSVCVCRCVSVLEFVCVWLRCVRVCEWVSMCCWGVLVEVCVCRWVCVCECLCLFEVWVLFDVWVWLWVWVWLRCVCGWDVRVCECVCLCGESVGFWVCVWSVSVAMRMCVAVCVWSKSV